VSMKIGVLSSLLLASFAAYSQNGSDEQDPLEGKVSLGYLATSGNTDSTNANAAFNLILRRMLWSHDFGLTAVKAENSGDTTAEAYTAGYVARREFGEKSYLFAGVNWQSDKFSSYDEQMSETVGYGRRLIENDRHMLNGELGVGARQADLRDGTSEDEAIWRGAIDYAWTVSDTTTFSQDLIVESGSSNTTIESISELRARLIGNIALVLSLRIKNNSDVLPGTEKTDRFTAISLEYAF